jgi:DNA polymerase-3 subunit gamma/tau
MTEALYRKYRPQIFEDVVGQEHIARTIKNAIGQDKVSHAYLFCGPRGTGKTTTARLLAKALLCDGGSLGRVPGPTPDPDGTCDNCLTIANGTHQDVYELDAASRTGVENVREEIIGRVQFAPTKGRYKVYIIDEVHMLSTAAFNALLKTLEEPPAHVVFILCTTDAHKVPETIHSRCQRFDFHRISVETIVSRLGAICVAEEVEFEGEALDLIAHRAEGGMRNALTSLEQIIVFGEGKVVLSDAERMLGALETSEMVEIVNAIGNRDANACFSWTANFVETGSDLAHFVRDLTEHMRNMYVLSLTETDAALDVSDAMLKELVKERELFGPDRIARALGVLGEVSAELRTSINPRLSFEIALTRLVRPDSDITLEALAERIEALENLDVQKPENLDVQKIAVPSDSRDESQPVAEKTPITGKGDVGAAPPSSDQQTTLKPPDSSEEVDLSNPAALQRVWQSAVQTIKKQKAAYGVLFINTKVYFNKKTQDITIEFSAENTFAYNAVRKPEAMELISQALEQAAGKNISFRFEQAKESLEQAPPTEQAPPIEQAAPKEQAAPTEQAPPEEVVPLDVYEDWRAAKASPPPAQTAAAPAANNVEEADIATMLAQEYGEDLIIEEIAEEEVTANEGRQGSPNPPNEE